MKPLSALAGEIAGILKQRGETIAVSESSTGGLVSAALLSIPGASAYFVGGGVIYTQQAREGFLGIDFTAHPGMRSSTEDYARLAAQTVRERLGTVWGLSETGAAGPRGNRYGDAAGHTCIAVAGPHEISTTLETGISGREENMWIFAEKTLAVFADVLRSTDTA